MPQFWEQFMKKNVGLSFYQPKKKVHESIFTEVLGCLVLMVIAIFMAVVIVYFFGMTSRVVGASMEPGLSNGQTILVNRFAYVLFMPKKGDVVVFLPHGNEKTHDYVKRIVAVQGDKVQIIDGRLYVNDVPSELFTGMIDDPGIAENPITLGNRQYFCIGDNPADGEDSRKADIGPVDKKDIIGKAWLHLSYGEDKLGLIK